MDGLRTFGAVLLTLFLLGTVGRAVLPDAGRPSWSSSLTVGEPGQTYLYSATVRTAGAVDHVTLSLPPSARIVRPHVWSSLGQPLRVAALVGRSVTVALGRPVPVLAGRPVTVAIAGATNPSRPARRATVRMTLWSAAGRVLGSHTSAPVAFTRARPCRRWPTGFVAAENAEPGDPAWRLRTPANGVHLAAWADRVSAGCGDTVTLRVSIDDPDPRFVVDAYRMGYYGGAGARRVWRTAGSALADRQPAPRIVADARPGGGVRYHVTAAGWRRSLPIRIDGEWPPGFYLLRITGQAGRQTYVPLVVRDDTSRSKYLAQASTNTWQAYNTWGGYSLYTGPHGGREQAIRVTFDRPYGGLGDGHFLAREYGFVFWAERHGLDVSYWTDNDLATRPRLLARHLTLILMGHSEYWTSGMRRAVEGTVGAGRNLISFGANQGYWQAFLRRTAIGPARELVTWRAGPAGRFRDAGRAEQELFGSMYACTRTGGDIFARANWLWSGTGMRPGDRLRNMALGENDAVLPGYPTARAGPGGVQVLAASQSAACFHRRVASPGQQVVYYRARSGAQVFNAGTLMWTCALNDGCGELAPDAGRQRVVSRMTHNVLARLDR